MKSAITVLKEQVKHFYLIRRLSKYETKSKNNNNFLGSFWEILNPLIQLLIYWFVFQSIRQQSNIEIINGEEVPFVFWLISGFVVWIFFYKSTIEGSSSIYSRIQVLSKMNFPMSIVPSFVIFSNLYVHLIILTIAIVLLNIGGIFITIYYLQLLIVIPMTVFFIFGVSLITSTLSTIIRDVHQLLNAVLRMGLYLSPVLWEIGKLAEPISTIVKLNPLFYLIEGYRASLFGTEWYFITHWQYTLYFLVISIGLFLIGAAIHMKFRRHFIDFS